MTVNISNITGANTTFEIIKALNEASSSYFVTFLLLFVALIMFVSLKLRGYDTVVVFTTTSFAVFIISIGFVFTGLASITFVTLPLIATGFGAAFLIFSKQ